MKWFTRRMSLVTVIGMFGYTMFVFNNMNEQIIRINRNVHELMRDVYQREETTKNLLMTSNLELENY